MNRNRIGIDARFFAEAGPGRYVKNIVEHLEIADTQNEYLIFLRDKGFAAYTPKNPNFIKVLANVSWYSWEEQIVLLLKIMWARLDLYYVPHFNIPILYPFKIVTAIPDIIMHTYSTERGTTLPKPYFRFKKFVYKLVLLWAIFRSQKVIVPTNEVLSDMLSVSSLIHKDKFIVAPEGVDPIYLSNTSANTVDSSSLLTELGIKNHFLLYVSSMYEHKNVERLIQAFKILKEQYKYEGNLVLVGKKDKFSESVKNLISSIGLSDSIKMPGMTRYITDNEIVSLRKSAQLYVFPSLKEGFSLTPLEAQAVGLPCVISDIGCHKEVFEDSVVYFDPRSVEDIAAKINSTLNNPELMKDLTNRGYAQVKKYDWSKTAAQTLSVFSDALN